MQAQERLQTLSELKTIEAEKHARDDANNPQLPPGTVHKYSAAAKVQSGQFTTFCKTEFIDKCFAPTAAAKYASTIAGDRLSGPEIHASVPSAPSGTVDESGLVDKLNQQAAYAQSEGGAYGHIMLRIYPAYLHPDRRRRRNDRRCSS